MGYTHGKKWSHSEMIDEVYKVMKALNIKRLPTAKECKLVTGNYSLSNTIVRRGGFNWLAGYLKLDQSKCETRLGRQVEKHIKMMLEQQGYKIEQMSIKHPYDLIVNDVVKIDIKAANKYHSKESWTSYSFNLEKSNPTCDIYVIVCIDDDKKYERILVIPSKFLNQTQLCISGSASKYDIYKDRWDYIDQYNSFYESVV